MSETEKVLIRDARRTDARLIAWALTESFHFEHDAQEEERLREMVERDDTLYSYRHARVAEVDGVVVGSQTAYTGREYAAGRKECFQHVWPYITDAMVAEAPMESDEDEYHMEGIGILPKYRGWGISRLLIMDSVKRGQNRGYKKVAFLVAADSEGLMSYYERLGFRRTERLTLFDIDYIKMQYGQG